MNDDSLATHDMHCHVLSVLLTGKKKKRETDACLYILRAGLKGTVLNMLPLVIKGIVHPKI